MNHSTTRATFQQHKQGGKTVENTRGATFSFRLYFSFKSLGPGLGCGRCVRVRSAGMQSTGLRHSLGELLLHLLPPSLRHHNKLIPTLLTSHPRQSSELGARQGRTRAQGTGCRATARLGLTVTLVLMERLLGDGDDDVSRRDVSPRDVSHCRAVARGLPRSLHNPAAHAAPAETETGSNWCSSVKLFLFDCLLSKQHSVYVKNN